MAELVQETCDATVTGERRERGTCRGSWSNALFQNPRRTHCRAVKSTCKQIMNRFPKPLAGSSTLPRPTTHTLELRRSAARMAEMAATRAGRGFRPYQDRPETHR